MRDFIKSSKKRLFWGWIYPCAKEMGWFFELFRDLFTSWLYKVSKKFWFTEIGLVDFEKNAFKIFLLHKMYYKYSYNILSISNFLLKF